MQQDHYRRQDYDGGRAARYARSMGPGLAVLLVVIGLGLFAIAQFPSESAGEPPSAWDWIRHGVCFLGGALVSVGIMRGFNLWREVSGGARTFLVIVGVLLVLFAQLAIENYFDEGASIAGIPVWIIQHTMIFVGGAACYLGMNRSREVRQDD
jgi:peptidoglycan/LPS O-acetylase OafA/YrhL